jgi:hypothetical protein
MQRIKRLFSLAICLLFAISATIAQNKVAIAERYIINHLDDYDLLPSDIENMKLNDFYTSKHNGVAHVFFKQSFADIEIDDAILNINISPSNQVFHSGNRFHKDIKSKISDTKINLSATLALEYAAMYLDIIESLDRINTLEIISEKEMVFSSSGISSENIPVQLVYKASGDKIKLCWNYLIHMKSGLDVWSISIDAISGEMIDKRNHSVFCFGSEKVHHHKSQKRDKTYTQTAIPKASAFDSGMMSASYRVFAPPAENPRDGSHEIASDVPFSGPSPFGWHDIDAEDGAEFLITRGNNIYAYLDEDGNNSADAFEVNGGPELIFDHPFDFMSEPSELRASGLVNMFYTSNFMHDYSYIFGFDEEAGNYQLNNYENGGKDGDYIRAEGNDGDDIDNAVFTTTQDGVRGRMTMFLWDSPGLGKLRVEQPAEFSGHVFSTGDAEGTDGFGPPITSTPVTGQLAISDSGGDLAEEACTQVLNTSEINGKIAIVKRGECDFSLKAYNVQQAGAIGMIVCNTEENLVVMGAGEMADEIMIPSVIIRKSSCDTILNIVGNGVVSIVENPAEPPTQKSGMFSNGVIIHEYSHGISSRLTGGPSEIECLSNDEQMGEGWSDFFLLATTVKPGDNGEESRGIGSYLIDDDRGIRRFPYSTDMNINAQTMKDILNTGTDHPLGEVWTAATWDLYWALVDELGYNSDLSDKNSGNAIAVQLVMDGLKMQPCSPGFIDGRDAILAADLANNEGEYECLIWNAFARRGIGLDAFQGSTFNRNDNIEAFNVPSHCQASSVQDISDGKVRLTVFPNPNEGLFSMILDSRVESQGKLEIISVGGNLIYERNIAIKAGLNVQEINPGQIPSGLYFISIIGNGIRIIEKIVIE